MSVTRGFLCRTSRSACQRRPLQPRFEVGVLSRTLRMCGNFGNYSVHSVYSGGRDTGLLCPDGPHHTETRPERDPRSVLPSPRGLPPFPPSFPPVRSCGNPRRTEARRRGSVCTAPFGFPTRNAGRAPAVLRGFCPVLGHRGLGHELPSCGGSGPPRSVFRVVFMQLSAWTWDTCNWALVVSDYVARASLRKHNVHRLLPE